MDIETWQVVAAVALPLVGAGPLTRWYLKTRREDRAARARALARRVEDARQMAHDRRYGIQVGATQTDVQRRAELWGARVAAAAEAPMIEAMREKVR